MIEAATDEIETDGYEWVPAASRIQPEPPENDLVAAKRKLAAVLDTTEAGAMTANFDPQAVALVLRELHRLQRQRDTVRRALDTEARDDRLRADMGSS